MNSDTSYINNTITRSNLPINTKGKDFIVGDIHGEFQLFMKALKKLKFEKKTDRLICTGDLIDRGADSPSMLELLNEDYFFSTLGNHEDMLLKYGASKTKREHYWYPNGGQWWDEVETSVQNYFVELIKYKMPILMTLQCNNFQIGIVHADFPLNLSWNFTDDEISKRNITLRDFIWKRNRIEKNNSDFIEGVKYVFIGHTPVEHITKKNNCIFIDTGCGHYVSNRIRNPSLTICEIDNDKFIYHKFKK
ncbi:TPA: metallophosphoesterase [Enterobacter cloacae]|nr:metallophosphoesterase [Enterobacter cloacae]HEB0932281.1 metallophosphoesterase [Enterobacter cloacae]HEB0946833.1 metallophosphoesterase [Enterobacter cloacae]HEB0966953.1 metallophosphoesterase [Enterobacter cloacae]